MTQRIGIGYDIHRLTEGRKLFIGGIEIPHLKGLLGYSDADVLLHAICDALLGAIGEADIGELFPNTDPRYQDCSSLELLREVSLLAKKKNFSVQNIDAVVILEEPRLSPFKAQMRERIASVLGIRTDYVNIKAKTNEGLGEIGNKDAAASFAAVMVSGGG